MVFFEFLHSDTPIRLDSATYFGESRDMKIFKLALVGIFAVFACSSLYTYFFLRNSLAPLDGALQLPGLRAETRVLRDSFGIPHIFAQNKTDALRALGFVMASERLFQMEISRRMTQGELSEVLGDVALPSDKLYRSLMLRRSVERMISAKRESNSLDKKMWTEMESFYAGVNYYIQSQPLPYELTLLGIQPRPFSPEDAYILTGHMAYSFGIALKADTLMTDLAKKLSPKKFKDLRNVQLPLPLSASKNGDAALLIPTKSAVPANPSLPVSSVVDFKIDVLSALASNDFYPAFEGSNAWLIGPTRSASGKSIFANDPHIAYSLPAVWVEAHIHTPDFELYGHYLPFIPYALLGHSRHHAWGFTMSLNDDMDLYQETLNPELKSALFKKEWHAYQEWTETIKIKDKADFELPMIETSHGPLMNAVLEKQNLSLKWAFHKIDNDPLLALYKMGEAANKTEFEEALKTGTAPGLNVMYADSENIAWWTFGDLALKKNPHSDTILNGASGDDEYERVLTWEEKPHLVNPASGVIITANSRPADINPNIRGDWQSDDRFRTITQALSEKHLWDVDETMQLQTSNQNIETKVLLAKLLENLKLPLADLKQHTNIIESLQKWNLHSEIDSKAASFYHQWNNENLLLLFKDWDEKDRSIYLSTPYAWVFYERVMTTDASSWWNERSQSQVVTEGFYNTVKKFGLTPEWGTIHTIEYSHPLGRIKPLDKILNLGPYAMPGAFNEINNNKMSSLGSDFNVRAGPSTRRVIDFASPEKSYGINPIGISGHILSPFYKDQVPLFLKGKYRAQLMNESDIQAAKTHELVLRP